VGVMQSMRSRAVESGRVFRRAKARSVETGSQSQACDWGGNGGLMRTRALRGNMLGSRRWTYMWEWRRVQEREGGYD
jgi:hypothetical protein